MRTRGFELVSEDNRQYGVDGFLPQRGSKTSAGYDFATPISVVIQPHSKELIWTNVKAYMQAGEVLEIYPRSSLGIKKGLRLANTVGVIDADYHNNESNEGNIGICLYNDSDAEVKLEAGERIAQGIFKSFLESDNGNSDKERTGGIGSTNTK